MDKQFCGKAIWYVRMEEKMNSEMREEHVRTNLEAGLNPEHQCIYCGDPLFGPMGGVLNEDGDAHVSCEEENDMEVICCPVCWEPSDFCQGHGSFDMEQLGDADCEICSEPLNFHIHDSTCCGHSLYEIKEHVNNKEEDSINE